MTHTSDGTDADMGQDVADLRAAVGLEERESTSHNAEGSP